MRASLPGWIRDLVRAWLDRVPRPLAIAFDAVPGETDYAGAIRGAQLQAIVRLTPVAIIASCLNAALFLATWASVGRPPLELWIWGLLILALAGNYLRSWVRSRK